MPLSAFALFLLLSRYIPLSRCIPFKSNTINLISIQYNSPENWLHVKAEDICTFFLPKDNVHISEPRWEREGQLGPEDGRNNGWKKEGQMEVTWLLTNRKHGGKTKSVSVLKAALTQWRDGKKTEIRLLMIEKKEETERIYPNKYDIKRLP